MTTQEIANLIAEFKTPSSNATADAHLAEGDRAAEFSSQVSDLQSQIAAELADSPAPARVAELQAASALLSSVLDALGAVLVGISRADQQYAKERAEVKCVGLRLALIKAQGPLRDAQALFDLKD